MGKWWERRDGGFRKRRVAVYTDLEKWRAWKLICEIKEIKKEIKESGIEKIFELMINGKLNI